MSAPFVWIYVCLAGGIFAASAWHVPASMLFAGAACAMLSLRTTKYLLALTAQSLFLFLVGLQLCAFQNREYRSNELRRWVAGHPGETMAVRATVNRTPELAREYFVLYLDVQKIGRQTIQGTARVTVSGRSHAIPVTGDSIDAYVRFRIASNFRTEGAFDYERYLRKEGIHVLGSIKNAALLHRTGSEFSLRSVISRLRLRLIQSINHALSPGQAGLLRALWLDDRRELSTEVEQSFIDAGVFHVIAISGFHVAVLVSLVFFALKRFVRYSWALVIVVLILSFYYLLLEGRSSITRTFLTFLILVFAFQRREGVNLGNVLAGSAILQLILNPLELFDAGYQLTYLSTAGLVFLALPLCRKVRLPRRIYQLFFNFLAVNLCVQFVLTPYQALVFHKIPFASLLANFIVLPLSSCLIAAAPFALPIIAFHRTVSAVLDLGLRLFTFSAEFFSGHWLLITSKPPLWLVFLFYGALTATLLFKKRSRYCALSVALCALLVILVPRHPSQSKDFRAHFIDVGQGDAILLEYPDGTFDLVDSGGFWSREALDTGEAILFPYLCHLGVKQLGRVFLTHAHADHMNGFPSVLRYIPAREFYVTRQPVGDVSFRNFLSQIEGTVVPIHQGQEFAQAGVQLKVLAPPDSGNTASVSNEDSLVLIVEYRGKKLLLTGDLERWGEVKLCDLKLNTIDFLKVPHHGSKTSSSPEFLDETRPKMAFISVGRDNWFGHPHPDVLNRYRTRRVTIYRTDQAGTIRLTWNKDDVLVDSYVWNHW